jgi:hypothetical protein
MKFGVPTFYRLPAITADEARAYQDAIDAAREPPKPPTKKQAYQAAYYAKHRAKKQAAARNRYRSLSPHEKEVAKSRRLANLPERDPVADRDYEHWRPVDEGIWIRSKGHHAHVSARPNHRRPLDESTRRELAPFRTAAIARETKLSRPAVQAAKDGFAVNPGTIGKLLVFLDRNEPPNGGPK